MILVHDEFRRGRLEFEKIVGYVTSLLNEGKRFPKEYLVNRNGLLLEKDVHKILAELSLNKEFEQTFNKVELVSGHSFPDIVAYCKDNNAFGLEVKTTSKNKWTTTGSSILENTRVPGVDSIYLLFGKLTTPPQFRSGLYQNCLTSVAVTHSPRYLIDMDTKESIFKRIGIEYDALRKLDNPFKPIKKYLRTTLRASGEDLWWVDEKEDSPKSIIIKAWNNLSAEEKRELKTNALAFFPDLLGNGSRKYIKISSWLVAKYGIVNHALRDTFTAGGQVTFNGIAFPKIYASFFGRLNEIRDVILSQEVDDLEFYWDVNLEATDGAILEKWKELCLNASKTKLSTAEQCDYFQDQLNSL